MNLPQYLTEVKEMLERATPGKWSYDTRDEQVKHGPSKRWPNGGVITADRALVLDEDGQLIASAPTTIATLIKIVEIYGEALKDDDDFFADQIDMVCNITGTDNLKQAHQMAFEAGHGLCVVRDNHHDAQAQVDELLETTKEIK